MTERFTLLDSKTNEDKNELLFLASRRKTKITKTQLFSSFLCIQKRKETLKLLYCSCAAVTVLQLELNRTYLI